MKSDETGLGHHIPDENFFFQTKTTGTNSPCVLTK